MNIVYDSLFEDWPWWVTWPVSCQTPGDYYRLKAKYQQVLAELEIPFRERSIYHVDASKRYVGFETEINELTFVLVFSGDIAK
jgi:hypothetical protein